MVARTPLGKTPLHSILIVEGRTQAWLARCLTSSLGRRVYRQEVSDWCRGIHDPEASTKQAIADELHRPVSQVFPPVEPEALTG